VFSHVQGKVYYSSKTERFYEVNTENNLWVESKKGDILYQKINEIVKRFLLRKIKENQEYIHTQSHLTNFTSILSKLKQEIGNKRYLDAQPEAWKPIIHKLRQIDTWEKKYISKINGERLRNEIRKDLQILCKEDTFPDKLDVNLCQIAFQDGILDLRTLAFRKGIIPSDYLTKTLDYPYVKPTDETKRQELYTILLKICNWKEEHLEYMLSVLGYALLGIPQEQKALWFILGQTANNGKSTVFDTLTQLLPLYVHTLNSKSLEESYDKKHKWIKATQGKRLLWIDELRKNKLQDTSMMKKIGDGMSLDTEILYGTQEDIAIRYKLFFVSNHSPSFVNDKGMENRMKVVKLQSSFRDDVETDDFERRIFTRDHVLYQKLQRTLKYHFLEVLFEYAHRYITRGHQLPALPVEFQEETEDVLEGNHNFEDWFHDMYEIGRDYEYPKKVFEMDIKYYYEKENGLRLGSTNGKDALKSFGMYRYSKDEMIRDRNTNYKGKLIGFRMKEEKRNEMYGGW